MDTFQQSILEIIIETSTNLPADVRASITEATVGEVEGTRAAQALEVINQNIDQACQNQGAICQDTGMPTFEVDCPVGANQIEMADDIRWAIAEATHRVLRPGGAFLVYQFSTRARDYMARHFAHIEQDFEPLNVLPCKLFWGWKDEAA